MLGENLNIYNLIIIIKKTVFLCVIYPEIRIGPLSIGKTKENIQIMIKKVKKQIMIKEGLKLRKGEAVNCSPSSP